MKRKPHSHPCVNERHGCTGTVPCNGELERNHDGFPAIVCEAYHLDSGELDAQSCEVCLADTCLACERVVRWEGHADECTQQLDRELSPAEAARAASDALQAVLQARK